MHARRIQGAIETQTKSTHTKNKTKAQNTNRSIERIDVSGSIDRKPKEDEHPKQQGKTQAIEPLEVEAGDAAVAGMHWGWLPASVQLNRTPVEAGAACPHPPNCRERPRPNCARPIDPSTRASIEEGRIEAADRSVGRLIALARFTNLDLSGPAVVRVCSLAQLRPRPRSKEGTPHQTQAHSRLVVVEMSTVAGRRCGASGGPVAICTAASA